MIPFRLDEPQKGWAVSRAPSSGLKSVQPELSDDIAILKPVEELWFEDGNIVLQAGSCMYKVYRGILCRSSVFRDMVDFPQPENIPTVDGHPLILIHDDPEDATRFFDALFNTTSSFFDISPDFETVVSVLRLATKYDVPHLRTRVLRYFNSWFPMTLEDFDLPPGKTLAGQIKKNFMALSVARICNVPWILPVALYRCSTFSLPVIMASTEDSDPELVRQGFTAREYRDLLIKGHHEFSRAMHLLVWAPIRERCLHDELGCNSAKLHCLDSVLQNSQALSLDTMDSWDHYSSSCPPRTYFICEACHTTGKIAIGEARQALWDRIPHIFGLDTKVALDCQRASDVF